MYKLNISNYEKWPDGKYYYVNPNYICDKQTGKLTDTIIEKDTIIIDTLKNK